MYGGDCGFVVLCRWILQGGARHFRGDVESTGKFRETHFFEIALAEIFETALDDSEEFLGSDPFLFTVLGVAFGPISGGFPSRFGFSVRLLFEQAGIEMVNALAPIVFAGPVFDRGQLLAKFVRNGLE